MPQVFSVRFRVLFVSLHIVWTKQDVLFFLFSKTRNPFRKKEENTRWCGDPRLTRWRSHSQGPKPPQLIPVAPLPLPPFGVTSKDLEISTSGCIVLNSCPDPAKVDIGVYQGSASRDTYLPTEMWICYVGRPNAYR